jgi:hypothetical protein
MKSIRKSMWGMYWKLHDKRKRLAASLKGYLDGLPPETRRRIVLGMFAAFAVLALYTFGRAVYDIGRNDGSHMETGHAGRVELPTPAETGNHLTPYLYWNRQRMNRRKRTKLLPKRGNRKRSANR